MPKHMPMRSYGWPAFADTLIPSKAVALGDSRSLEELNRLANIPQGTCCEVCDNEVWRYGGGELCFPCTTGESDPSEDYELIPEPQWEEK